MDDVRFGTVFRTVRQRRGWRQADVAKRSGMSQSAVSRIERGQVGPQSIDTVRALGATLEIRVGLIAQWRGGDLDRLLNRRHSMLHESVARMFRDVLPAWILAPEVSFSIYGERGIIDILAWHPDRRALLVVELKTDLVDVNELVGTLDRKRRLANAVGERRGWEPATVSAWLIVAASRTNSASGRRASGDASGGPAGSSANDRAMASGSGRDRERSVVVDRYARDGYWATRNPDPTRVGRVERRRQAWIRVEGRPIGLISRPSTPGVHMWPRVWSL